MAFTEHESQAVLGWGTYLQIGATATADPSVEVFTDMFELISLTPPDEQAPDVKVTHFGSPARTEEYIRGLLDAGEASFGVNYRPDVYPSQALIVELKRTGEKRNIRMVLPGGMETIDFIGYVKGF